MHNCLSRMVIPVILKISAVADLYFAKLTEHGFEATGGVPEEIVGDVMVARTPGNGDNGRSTFFHHPVHFVDQLLVILHMLQYFGADNAIEHLIFKGYVLAIEWSDVGIVVIELFSVYYVDAIIFCLLRIQQMFVGRLPGANIQYITSKIGNGFFYITVDGKYLQIQYHPTVKLQLTGEGNGGSVRYGSEAFGHDL